MQEIKTKMVRYDGREELNVFIDRFTGPTDVLETCRKRKLKGSMLAHDDYFAENRYAENPRWSGFECSDDLWGKLEGGITDDSLTKDALRYAMTAKVQEEEKLRDIGRNVYGGAVIVPAVMCGDPRAMWCVKRKKVRSRIIQIGIDVTLTANFSASRYEMAGRAVVKTIARLEKAGYRVSVDVIIAVYLSGSKIIAMTMPTKRSSEVMNFRRILYPLTDTSFFRGVGFGWIVRQPHMNPSQTGLGQSVDSAFGYSERDDKLEELYGTILGQDRHMVMLRDLARKNSEEEAARWLEAQLLDTGA